jgi:hypothetical protein
MPLLDFVIFLLQIREEYNIVTFSQKPFTDRCPTAVELSLQIMISVVEVNFQIFRHSSNFLSILLLGLPFACSLGPATLSSFM